MSLLNQESITMNNTYEHPIHPIFHGITEVIWLFICLLTGQGLKWLPLEFLSL